MSDAERKIEADIRKQYAYTLRHDGMTFKAIGARIGTGVERTRQLVYAMERKLKAEATRLSIDHDLRGLL